ncbi:hypothetical protein LG291_22410 [Cytobacillus firmus]|uniref:flagellin N-terminal helical domain-containing protein n=1 Tax=Cytobacillus firmus TaxID=1399 RepID=UPI00384AF5BD
MIINNNIPALNTYRQMGANQKANANAMEKLSSGLRINKAGDDAAGLAISEKMRAQVRGLDQASRNSQDGISMIQTAEGALQETQNILQRMRELATQAANDTNVEVDRAEIQKEMNALTSEINRIGETTEFNTQKLLNGGGKEVKSSATAGKTANGLDVPTELTGGTGATQVLASAEIDIDAINATATADDDKGFSVTLGEKTINVVYDSTMSGTAGDTSFDSDTNTITLKTGNSMSGATVAASLETALESVIANDESLKGKYNVSINNTDVLNITATAKSLNTDGELTGGGVEASVSIENGTGTAGNITSTNGETNIGSVGTNATATIDFSNSKVEDLVGSSIVIDGKKIDFYDSGQSSYTSENGSIGVDLNGARSPEKIVDAIVAASHNSGTSNFTNVFVTKGGENNDQLVITAKTAGESFNDSVSIGNNSAVNVTGTYGSNKVDGEEVVSAKGLTDGEHKVTISYVDASASVSDHIAGTGNLAPGDFTAVNVASGSDLEGGTYRLIGDGSSANDVIVEKLQSDGSWSSAGLSSEYTTPTTLGAGDTSATIGDLTFTFGSYTAGDFSASGDDYVTFTLDAKHYEATLTEADGTSGPAVRISSGEDNVKLTAQDGIGEAVVNVGAFDTTGTSFQPGDSISWSFETKAASEESSKATGGTFEATFQIGANSGQSMTIQVNDMRAQALGVSGKDSAGTITAKNGETAKLTAAESVTNGTNNENVEFALDVSTHENASAAISVINDAIESVSAQRSSLGAFQNRLEHTISNLGTSSENLQAAESRIRDVDMAKEVMEMTRTNILSQASQAMLAQANQKPQSVLQLLG